MSLQFIHTEIPEVILVQPRVFEDERGFFLETYHQQKYYDGGITKPFVQDNWSNSERHILRGLHFQLRQPQGKLVFVTLGAVMDVAVDLRRGSLTFGQSVTRLLSAENKHQLYVPEGFGHGFLVLSDVANVTYKCTALYDPTDDRGIRWNDPRLGVKWGIDEPTLSAKDKQLPFLNELSDGDLPQYGGN